MYEQATGKNYGISGRGSAGTEGACNPEIDDVFSLFSQKQKSAQQVRARPYTYVGGAVSRDEGVSSMIFQTISELYTRGYTRGAPSGIFRKWLPHKVDLEHIGQKICIDELILFGLGPLNVT